MSSNAPSCPIGREQADGNAARIVAAQVTILLAISLASHFAWPIALLLTLDFSLRLSPAKRWSPLSRLAIFIEHTFSIPCKMQNAAPKQFAAFLGLVFSTSLLLLTPFHLEWIKSTIVSGFAVCAFLEAAFAFCFGCKMYQILPDLFRSKLASTLR